MGVGYPHYFRGDCDIHGKVLKYPKTKKCTRCVRLETVARSKGGHLLLAQAGDRQKGISCTLVTKGFQLRFTNISPRAVVRLVKSLV